MFMMTNIQINYNTSTNISLKPLQGQNNLPYWFFFYSKHKILQTKESMKSQ